MSLLQDCTSKRRGCATAQQCLGVAPTKSFLTMDERPGLAELQNHVTTTKWINLGLQLGLRDNDLKEIELKYSDMCDCRREMLSIWLKTSPGACRKHLLEALKKDSVAEFSIAGNYNTFIQQLSRGMLKLM